MKNYKSMSDMIEAAREAIVSSTKESAVYIGCDSLRKKKNGSFSATYSTVVVLHKDGNKGCQLFHFTETIPDYGSMKQRLLTEVGYAVQVGVALVEDIGDRHLELHCDVNSCAKGKSHIAMKEAIGYVQGCLGFEPKFKPHAWAASHAGDHVVRH